MQTTLTRTPLSIHQHANSLSSSFKMNREGIKLFPTSVRRREARCCIC